MRIRLVPLLLALPLTTFAADGAPSEDPVLNQLIADALAARPELAAAESRVRAEELRARQAGVLPDPMLQLGAERDQMVEVMGEGSSLMVTAETGTYFSAMVSQSIPFPTKLLQRGQLARFAVDALRADVERLRLSTEAEVRRAYLELLLAREQLALLSSTEVLWTQSEKIARTRYEVGEAPQTDVLRAQLERTRLRQRRLALETNERLRLQTLNRLRVKPLDTKIDTTATLTALPAPVLPAPDAALEEAQARSPELKKARLATAEAERARSLARSELLPDLGVYAGVMPQGMETMWQAGVQISLPIFALQKQLPAIREAKERVTSQEREVDVVLQTLQQRIAERQAALEAVLETNRIFSGGLLVQSEAAANSALGQYQAGRVAFTTVLEALGGFLADRGSYLESLAAAHRIAILAREVSLDPVGDVSAAAAAMPGSNGGMGGASSGAMPGGSASSSSRSAPRGGAAASSTSTGGGMGGM